MRQFKHVLVAISFVIFAAGCGKTEVEKLEAETKKIEAENKKMEEVLPDYEKALAEKKKLELRKRKLALDFALSPDQQILAEEKEIERREKEWEKLLQQEREKRARDRKSIPPAKTEGKTAGPIQPPVKNEAPGATNKKVVASIREEIKERERNFNLENKSLKDKAEEQMRPLRKRVDAFEEQFAHKIRSKEDSAEWRYPIHTKEDWAELRHLLEPIEKIKAQLEADLAEARSAKDRRVRELEAEIRDLLKP